MKKSSGAAAAGADEPSVLTSEEKSAAQVIGIIISEDLFQGARSGERSDDCERIQAHLEKVLSEMKSAGYNLQDLARSAGYWGASTPDNPHQMTRPLYDLVGTHTSDRAHKYVKHDKGEGLAQLYYDQSKYTAVGAAVTGKVWMPKARLDDEAFIEAVKGCIAHRHFGEEKHDPQGKFVTGMFSV